MFINGIFFLINKSTILLVCPFRPQTWVLGQLLGRVKSFLPLSLIFPFFCFHFLSKSTNLIKYNDYRLEDLTSKVHSKDEQVPLFKKWWFGWIPIASNTILCLHSLLHLFQSFSWPFAILLSHSLFTIFKSIF